MIKKKEEERRSPINTKMKKMKMMKVILQNQVHLNLQKEDIRAKIIEIHLSLILNMILEVKEEEEEEGNQKEEENNKSLMIEIILAIIIGGRIMTNQLIKSIIKKQRRKIVIRINGLNKEKMKLNQIEKN